MKIPAALALLLVPALVAAAYQLLSPQHLTTPPSLTTYVPQDALLTIESPDFSALLHQWTSSAESKAWLASQSYSVFQNSRLFGRLGDAQASFSKAAGMPAGADLLEHIAGKQSVFAWYDIGKLQFLYITRMPAAQADQSELFQARGSFERRHAGNADFYIRSSAAEYSTVAFAHVSTPSGELLLLATREDLIANALTLIATSDPPGSIQQEPWFQDVAAALPAEKSPPALHMVLNLDRIAIDPHFRTYWIQRNITWTRQFRAAASDLYVEPTRFREERVLLPKALSSLPPVSVDIASLASVVPPSTGVVRVLATRDSSIAVTAIQEKLLGSSTAPGSNPQYAPAPVTGAPENGNANDLETRIDTAPTISSASSATSLASLFDAASLDAVLTLSSASPPAEKMGLWTPIHNAVLLHTANALPSSEALAEALQNTLRSSLTVASIGIVFQPGDAAGAPIHTLTGPRPLFFAVSSTQAYGNLVLLADDQSLLADLLHNLATIPPARASTGVSFVAAFNHSSQRAAYHRLTSLLDGTNNQTHDIGITGSGGANRNGTVESAPSFFSGNVQSISDTFATLQAERIVERADNSNLRQTVAYSWQTP